MAHTITNVKNIQGKSRAHRVTQVGPSQYTVTSGSSRNEYSVKLGHSGATCTCKWAQYRPASDKRAGCSHVVSVYNHIENQAGRTVSAWGNIQSAQRQHRPMMTIGDGVTLTSRI